MSRSSWSYDEEWQRRKSVLIRSLFHDIPILSPVEEESNSSSQDYHAPIQEVLFPSPPRPYSPLPPLIIERVPITNKHDEPEVYYTKLEKKIKKIYVKLFIEKRNLSSIEHDTNSNDRSVNDDNLTHNDSSDSVENLDLRFLESISPGHGNFDSIIEDKEARQSSASTKSNGYGADLESMDTAIVDVVNYTTSNEDVEMISEEEGSNERRYKESDNWRSSEQKKSSRERTDDRVSSEEHNSKHSTIDDQEMTENEESSESEHDHSYEEEESTNEDETTEETNQTVESDRVKIDDPKFNVDESRHSRINDQEMTDSDDSSEQKKEQETENKTKTDSSSQDSEPKPTGGEKAASEGGNGNVETSSSSDGPDYRQITTQALVHFDGPQDTVDRESRVYEDSVKSIILPTRIQRVVSRNVYDGMKLEEKEDPKPASTFDTDQGETTEDDFEEVRTPPPDVFGEDIGAMATSTPETTQKEFEKRRTNQLDTPDVEAIRSHKQKDLEEIGTYHSDASDSITSRDNADMRIHQLEAVQKQIEAMRTSAPETTEKEFEEKRTPRLDTSDVEVIRSHKQKSIAMDLEEIGTYHSDTSDVTNADTRIHQLEAVQKKIVATRTSTPETTEKEFEEKRNPRLQTPEEDIEAMRSHKQKSTEMDFEEIGTYQSDATDADMRTHQVDAFEEKIVAMRTSQSESNEGEDGKENVEDVDFTSLYPVEEMRSPRPDVSRRTMPVTHRSDPESTDKHTALPQVATMMTSSSQDGADQNITDLQTSNDINDILTSIFNESRSKDGTPVSGKKRKLVDKEVQAVPTRRLTWEEMRTNFFVGTPKIFRLCACTDHVCY